MPTKVPESLTSTEPKLSSPLGQRPSLADFFLSIDTMNLSRLFDAQVIATLPSGVDR